MQLLEGLVQRSIHSVLGSPCRVCSCICRFKPGACLISRPVALVNETDVDQCPDCALVVDSKDPEQLSFNLLERQPRLSEQLTIKDPCSELQGSLHILVTFGLFSISRSSIPQIRHQVWHCFECASRSSGRMGLAFLTQTLRSSAMARVPCTAMPPGLFIHCLSITFNEVSRTGWFTAAQRRAETRPWSTIAALDPLEIFVISYCSLSSTDRLVESTMCTLLRSRPRALEKSFFVCTVSTAWRKNSRASSPLCQLSSSSQTERVCCSMLRCCILVRYNASQ